MTFVVAEEKADGADEDSAIFAEYLCLVAVMAAVLDKAALLELSLENPNSPFPSRFQDWDQ